MATSIHDKSRLREELKLIRKNIPFEDRKKAARDAVKVACVSPVILYANSWYLYSAIRDEFDLSELFAEGIRMGKHVYYPRVEGKQISFYRVTSLEQLAPGAYGILEPIESCAPAPDDENGVCFAPGLGFSEEGARIGYGGGYYDWFLMRHPSLLRVGCAYKEQMVSDMVCEAHDVLMDLILTPQALIDCMEDKEDMAL